MEFGCAYSVKVLARSVHHGNSSAFVENSSKINGIKGINSWFSTFESLGYLTEKNSLEKEIARNPMRFNFPSLVKSSVWIGPFRNSRNALDHRETYPRMFLAKILGYKSHILENFDRGTGLNMFAVFSEGVSNVIVTV